jgi:CHAT domain-containing protein
MKMHADSARLANWQEQLFHTRDSFNKQMEELYRDYPQLVQFESASMDFSLEQIRRNLKRKETLVEYFIGGASSPGKEELFIFVLSKNECHVCRSPVDPVFHPYLETITQNLHGFVPYLETRERFDSLQMALFGIYQAAVHPVIPFLRGKKLIIVPDEMLSYIPFDALITHHETDSISNYAGASYLLHEYDISYMYNSQLINHKHPRAWRFPVVTAWLPGNARTSPGSLGNLKGAVEEVADILELVKGQSIQESLAKQDLINLLEEASILHLAMHTLATENSGSSPYFILDTIADPLLANQIHDYEISALQLSSPMVVLSSCETAGGQLYRGEGIMSLSRSFLQAGAPSVVHSLWPVEDAKSREIMVGFYGGLKKGLTKRSALSRVKRQYLDQQPPFYTHPYYWAAFQITGDTSAIHNKRNYALGAGSILLAVLLLSYLMRASFFRKT